MRAGHMLAIAGVLLLTTSMAALAQEDMKADWGRIIAQARDETPGEERLTLINAFLEKYPDSDRAPVVANMAADIFIHQLKRPDEGIGLLTRLRSAATSEKLRSSYTAYLIQAYGGMGDLESLRRFVAEVSKEGEIDPFMHSGIGSAALAAQDYEFAVEHFEQAFSGATEEWYKAHFAFMPEDRMVEHRGWFRGRILSDIGKANIKLKRYAEAEEAFAKAATMGKTNIVGVSVNDNALPWATTLVEQGKTDEAIEMLLLPALVQKNDEASELLESLYHKKNGEDADFAAFAREQSRKLAVSAPELTLNDYAGNAVSLSAHKGKVVMLNFWFPT